MNPVLHNTSSLYYVIQYQFIYTVSVYVTVLRRKEKGRAQALGSICTAPDTCADCHATCSEGNPCTCDAGYCDSNGATTPGGTCAQGAGRCLYMKYN
jgi:hypothetical protein